MARNMYFITFSFFTVKKKKLLLKYYFWSSCCHRMSKCLNNAKIKINSNNILKWTEKKSFLFLKNSFATFKYNLKSPKPAWKWNAWHCHHHAVSELLLKQYMWPYHPKWVALMLSHNTECKDFWSAGQKCWISVFIKIECFKHYPVRKHYF